MRARPVVRPALQLRPPRLPPPLRYAGAPACVLAAWGVQAALLPEPEFAPFVFFFLAVAAAAWLGGVRPGLLAVALSAAVVDYFILEPHGDWKLAGPELLAVASFLVSATAIAVLCGSLRTALAAVDERAQLLRAVLEQMPAGVMVADAAGRVLTSNARMGELLGTGGAPPPGAPASPGARAQRADGRPCGPADWPLARSLGRGETVRGEEIHVVRADGSRDILSVDSAPVRDGRGRLAAGVAVALDLGERRRAEAALRRYELLSENTRDVILFIDRDSGRILDANAAAAAYGYPREELLGRTIADLRAPDERALIPQQLAEADARGLVFETVHRRGDGTLFPVEVSSHGATLDGARVLVSVVRDLTAQKRVEEALRRRETALAQAGQMAHLGVWEIELLDLEHLDRNPLAWSDEVFRIFGHEPGSVPVTNQLFFEHVPPDDRPRVQQAVAQALAGGRPYVVEHRVVRPDGTERIVQEHAEVVREAGRPARLLGAVQDVTEQRLAEQALRERERDLNRAQAVARTGSWQIDVRRDRLVWSDETHRMFGVAPDTPLTYERFLAAVHPDDREEVNRHWRAALRGAPYDVEHRIVVGGEVKWVRERAQLEFDDQGGLRGGFGTVQDVTEQRRAEQALRAANERLAEADRRKDEFLAMLSHELRNPLAAIRNAVFLLHRSPPASERAARARDIVDRQSTQLARLVEDLLDLTRVSRGKIRLQRQPVDLGALARRAAEDHRPLFEAAGVALELQSCPGPLPALADPARVAQILGNLLTNAAKFTGRGGRAVLTVERREGGALLRVADTGAGISPAMLPRLFEPFAQDQVTLDRSRGGLGLGLALVKALAELHGGSASARSEGPGRGAEFTVRLPLAAGPAPTDEAPAPAPARTARRRVLVVEDNPDAAESLRDALELAGCEVTLAADGPQGLAAARALRPDIVLCDVGLPNLDGYAVARALRADPELSSTLLVALTGYVQPEDRERALAAGFDAHLGKPADPRRLLGLIAGEPAAPGA